MRKLLTTAAALIALIGPANATKQEDALYACMTGYATVASHKGLKGIDAVYSYADRHCKHIKALAMSSFTVLKTG